MKSSYCTQVFVKILIVVTAQLVVTSGAEGRLGPCPPGQLTHHVPSGLMCCLPVNCQQNHFVTFCLHNGTRDTCEPCPRSFALFKRTSSFAYEPCKVFPLVSKNCAPLPGNPKATEEDLKHCYCQLEKGMYYMKPQVPLGPTSFCQPFPTICHKGQQPTHRGVCEPCPRNTVQDVDENFFLCRPQKNCTAMGLETEEAGTTERETVCAQPPSLPSHRPQSSTDLTTTSAVLPVKPTTKKPTVVTVKNPVLPSVGPVLEPEGSANFTITHIVVLCASGVVLLILIISVTIYARRKGWCAPRNTCQRHCDMENRPYPVNPAPCDTDNASDDSCCACADSCLASSGKSGVSGKTGACALPPCKHPGHLPMLEGYMNGKCGHPLDHGQLSEPLYNSISHDEAKMATYQNVNGIPPQLTQHGFGKATDFDYNYPSKVRLPSVESEDDHSLKKGHDLGAQDAVAGKGKEGKDREDFTETDPLLPNLETVSCGTHPPAVTHPLRGILRNGNNRQEATVRGGGGDGREVGGGNRPNLSMLLSSVEGSSHESGASAPAANLPYLSQLVSSPHSVPGAGPQPEPHVQHQQLQQQAAPEPTQHVHELPLQLQRHLLQQQQQQEGSTLALRLMPTSAGTQAPVNTSLVQMDELKPAMSLQPSPTTTATAPPTTTTTAAAIATGAANIKVRKGHAGSPARIDPSQQKEVRSGGKGREDDLHRKASDAKPAEEVSKDAEGAGPGRRLDEQTFRKEALPAASPVEEEETTRKSVGGSSGLGDSLDLSSPLSLPSEDGRRSRSMYRRSNSEASRSVSPQLPLPPSRSISSPGDRNRPYAVVKPMQSDQSLDALSSSPDQLTELTRPLDSAGHQYPLQSLRSSTPQRQSSQDSSDEPDEMENA